MYKTEKEFLNELWRDLVGLPEQWQPYQEKMPSLESLRETERCPLLEDMALNRRIIGAFRYGLLGDPRKPCFDRLTRAYKELDMFIEDGNAEHLVDAYNMIYLEFVESTHPNFHMETIGDHDNHNKEL